MISGETEVNLFAQFHVILDAKFGEDMLENLFILETYR